MPTTITAVVQVTSPSFAAPLDDGVTTISEVSGLTDALDAKADQSAVEGGFGYVIGLTTAVGESVGVETAARIAADSAEATTRANADSTLSTSIATVQGNVNTANDLIGSTRTDLDTIDELIGRSLVATAPTKWAECGLLGRGWFTCTTVIPSPTQTMRVRRLSRFLVHFPFSPFAEGYSEAKDNTVDGDGDNGGNWDRFEDADWMHGGRLYDFWEHTEIGGTEEQWLAAQDGEPQLIPSLAAVGPTVASVWKETEVVVDIAAGTVTRRVRVDAGWDYEDEDDGTLWRTTGVYETGGATSIIASNVHANARQWVGRGGGRHDQARVRRWDDGVLVMDFDPSTADEGDLTVTDTVLLDDADDPAVWTAAGNDGNEAIIGAAAASGGGAVDSVNGDTGTVVVTPASIGAAPTSHTHTAGDLPAYPWPHRARIDFALDRPATVVGTYTPSASSTALTGGYGITGVAVGDTTWTYTHIPLTAGTYAADLIYRGMANAGIATFVVNGTTITQDTYRASSANDQLATAFGTFTVAASGYITVAVSNPTKNTGSAYGLSLQSLTLRRTGA